MDLTGGTGSLTCVAGNQYTLYFKGFANASRISAVFVNVYSGGSLVTDGTFSNGFDLSFELYTAIMLPVELTIFEVNNDKNKYNYLNWQTASELNNEGFEIERSHDGKNWENIGFERGNGTTQVEQNYEFVDERPLNGINYYRLKQMDFDGKFEYSDIQSVRFENGQNMPVQVFPNPVKNGTLTVRLSSNNGEEILINVFDLTGKTWLQQTAYSPTTNLNVNDLLAGIYVVKIAANGQIARQKVVISSGWTKTHKLLVIS